METQCRVGITEESTKQLCCAFHLLLFYEFNLLIVVFLFDFLTRNVRIFRLMSEFTKLSSGKDRKGFETLFF